MHKRHRAFRLKNAVVSNDALSSAASRFVVVALDEGFDEGPGFRKQVGIPFIKPSGSYCKRADCDVDPRSIHISSYPKKGIPLDFDFPIYPIQDEFYGFLVFPLQ
jgi:hypothetical protein